MKKLESMPDAVKYENEDGKIPVVHTNKDGTKEVCYVVKSMNKNKEYTWEMGTYRPKDGISRLAVIAGKVLKRIRIKRKSETIE